MQAPCYKCPDRKLGCHSNCSKYNEFKININLAKQNKKKEDPRNV